VDQFRYQLQSLVERGMESGEFRKDLRADITALTILGHESENPLISMGQMKAIV
jgi:hypothetical protein